MTLPFPKVIDSSMRSDFVSCPRQFFEAHIRNLRGSDVNVHLHFGGCFAKGLQVFRKNFYGRGESYRNVLSSLAAGAEAIILAWGNYHSPATTGSAANKSLEGCLDAYLSFLEKYPPDSDPIVPLMIDGEPCVEFSFAVPIPGVEHPDGGPILYAGRFDMLATYGAAPNCVFIDDEKTTSQLGESWNNKWRLRAQFTGYKWGAESYGHKIGGIIIRGVSILKRDIGHAFVLEQRFGYQVDQFVIQLQRDVKRMLAAWHEGFWDQNLDESCTAYGGCGYLNVCLSNDPEAWRQKYTVQPWDPLAKH